MFQCMLHVMCFIHNVCSYYSIMPRAVPGCPLHYDFGLGEHCRRLLHYHNKETDAQSVWIVLQKQPVTSYCVLCASMESVLVCACKMLQLI